MLCVGFIWQAERVYGARGEAGGSHAAVCPGLHSNGQSVEAGLSGTLVVYELREEVSIADIHAEHLHDCFMIHLNSFTLISEQTDLWWCSGFFLNVSLRFFTYSEWCNQILNSD